MQDAETLLPATRPPTMWRDVGICAAFAAAGFWLVSQGDAFGWFGVGFGGLGVVVLLLRLPAKGNHLRLGPDGFTIAILPVRRSFRWSEVDRFYPAVPDVVAFDLSPARGRRSLNQRLTRRFLGHDDALPQAYGMEPERLAALMNDWRTRATGVPPSPPSTVVVDQDGVRRRLPDGREEAVRWADLVEVAVRTTPHGPWQEDVFFLLTARGGGCAVPHGEAVDQDLLPRLQALPGFDNETVIEAMGSAEDAVFVCWREPGTAGSPGGAQAPRRNG